MPTTHIMDIAPKTIAKSMSDAAMITIHIGCACGAPFATRTMKQRCAAGAPYEQRSRAMKVRYFECAPMYRSSHD